MYLALARTVWTDVDKDGISEDIRRFRLRHVGLSDDDLMEKLIRQTAVRCGVVGAVASAPPGILAIVPLAADLSYQVLALNRLILTIAGIYGKPTTRPQRGGAVAASFAAGGGAEFLRRSMVKAAQRVLRRGAASRLVPVVGAVVAGAMSYGSVVAIGRQARDHYRARSLLEQFRGKARRK